MPAAWLRITVTSPSDERMPLLAEGLLATGGYAVEEDGLRLTTYLPLDTADAAEREAAAQAAADLRTILETLVDDDVAFEATIVPEEDWLAVWRRGLDARRVGERIVVAPTWIEPPLEPGDIRIRIDPQMAFGTAEHASTRGVLRLMQRVVRPRDRVLDVGTGSAILAIVAARLGARHVDAVESDADAIDNARENVAANDVADRVVIVHARVDGAFLDAHGAAAFDGILANVLSSVLTPLLPGFHRALAPGGWTILAGILTDEAEPMRAAALAHGFVIEAEDVEAEWWSVLLRRG